MHKYTFRIFYYLTFSFLVLTSCIPTRSFIAGTIDPVVVNKKNEKQLAVSIRPNSYLQADAAYALSDKIVIKCSAAGLYRFGDFSTSVLYNLSRKKIGLYAGPIINFQQNCTDIKTGDIAGTLFTYYTYNCEYHSAGALIGISINKDGYRKHHFIIKPQYNVVKKYEYYRLQSDRYHATENEYIKDKVPDFLSIEIAYALLIKMKKNIFFKIQIGGMFLQRTLTHQYSFKENYTPYSGSNTGQIINKIEKHPKSWPINLSIGFIFSSKKEPKNNEKEY